MNITMDYNTNSWSMFSSSPNLESVPEYSIVSLFVLSSHTLEQRNDKKSKHFLSRPRINSYLIILRIQRLLLSIGMLEFKDPPPTDSRLQEISTAPQPEPNKVTHLAFSCQ